MTDFLREETTTGRLLLAVFFFIAGVEVKRELIAGELSQWRAAALPFFAAGGGMLPPAPRCRAACAYCCSRWR